MNAAFIPRMLSTGLIPLEEVLQRQSASGSPDVAALAAGCELGHRHFLMIKAYVNDLLGIGLETTELVRILKEFRDSTERVTQILTGSANLIEKHAPDGNGTVGKVAVLRGFAKDAERSREWAVSLLASLERPRPPFDESKLPKATPGPHAPGAIGSEEIIRKLRAGEEL